MKTSLQDKMVLIVLVASMDASLVKFIWARMCNVHRIFVKYVSVFCVLVLMLVKCSLLCFSFDRIPWNQSIKTNKDERNFFNKCVCRESLSKHQIKNLNTKKKSKMKIEAQVSGRSEIDCMPVVWNEIVELFVLMTKLVCLLEIPNYIYFHVISFWGRIINAFCSVCSSSALFPGTHFRWPHFIRLNFFWTKYAC